MKRIAFVLLSVCAAFAAEAVCFIEGLESEIQLLRKELPTM